jgi:hypothetical protein
MTDLRDKLAAVEAAELEVSAAMREVAAAIHGIDRLCADSRLFGARGALEEAKLNLRLAAVDAKIPLPDDDRRFVLS